MGALIASHMVLGSTSSKVGHQVMDMNTISLKRSTWRNVEIANDFVDVNLSCYIATFGILLLDLL